MSFIALTVAVVPAISDQDKWFKQFEQTLLFAMAPAQSILGRDGQKLLKTYTALKTVTELDPSFKNKAAHLHKAKKFTRVGLHHTSKNVRDRD